MLRKSGYGEFVHSGHGTYNRKYVTEDRNALKFLDEFRKSIIVKAFK